MEGKERRKKTKKNEENVQSSMILEHVDNNLSVEDY